MSNMIIRRIKNITFHSKNWKIHQPVRAYFSHLLRAVSARSALFVEQNALFSTKNSKIACCLRGCSVINALNSKKWRVKTHNCPFTGLFLPFLGYTAHMPLFFRISPASLQRLFRTQPKIPTVLIIRPKKVVLFPEIGRVGIFFITHPPA